MSQPTGSLRPEAFMNHRTDRFGGLGAACRPVTVGLSVLRISQGYRQGPSLVYATRDGPEPGAKLLATQMEG